MHLYFGGGDTVTWNAVGRTGYEEMAEARKTLFEPIVPQEKLHLLFEGLRTSPGGEPARWMLDDVYQSFEDPVGNFLEQFQTAGFNARYFELYLFAYFSRSGFIVERAKPNPDFLVSRGNVRVAVEATTVNPPTSGVLAKMGKKISDLTGAELSDYERHELPIRFGSPLSSKLEKRYWELEHCKDLPFVLAIEAFHDEESLAFSESSLIQYLFGLDQIGIWVQGGRLRIETEAVREHTVGEKTIPSGFFGQPDTENISAVLFTNSGSNAKFSRMGYQHGIGCDVISMSRTGYFLNPHPDAMDPTFFSYNLDEPPFVEPWGQGLVVLHNPNALQPVPRDFFVDAVQGYLEAGSFRSNPPDWHPLSSKTLTLHLGEVKKKLRAVLPTRVAVGAITREQFQEACGFVIPESNPLIEEHGWFMDESRSFLGLLIRHRVDNDWGYVVLGRDQQSCFRTIEIRASFPTRYQARMELQLRIAEILSHPQRIFPQDALERG